MHASRCAGGPCPPDIVRLLEMAPSVFGFLEKQGRTHTSLLLPVQVPGLEGKQQIPFVHEVASDKVRTALHFSFVVWGHINSQLCSSTGLDIWP